MARKAFATNITRTFGRPYHDLYCVNQGSDYPSIILFCLVFNDLLICEVKEVEVK